jgi:hypothetical protein
MPVTFECPGCGTRSTFDRLNQTADEFCRQCDYPLFWATPLPSEVPEPEPEMSLAGLDPSLLRRPGVAGRVVPVGTNCPTCGEMNLMSAVYCVRCGNLMHPEPPAPPPEPEPEPELPPPPPPPPPRNWWPWIIAGIVLLILVIVLLVVLL